MSDDRVASEKRYPPASPEAQRPWWWVKNDSDYSYGPFDTERDARIAAKALSVHADWMTWEVVGE